MNLQATVGFFSMFILVQFASLPPVTWIFLSNSILIGGFSMFSHVFPCFSCEFPDFTMISPMIFPLFTGDFLASARCPRLAKEQRPAIDVEKPEAGPRSMSWILNMMCLTYWCLDEMASHTAKRIRGHFMIKKHRNQGMGCWGLLGGCWDYHSYLRIGYLWIIPSFLLIKHQ